MNEELLKGFEDATEETLAELSNGKGEEKEGETDE